MALHLSINAANASVDGATALLNAGAGPGVLEIRTGTQPANAAAAATGTLLATVTLNDPAFSNAVNGVAALNTATAVNGTGVANGNAGWFRAKDSNGVTCFDGACGTSGAELNLASIVISIGLIVSVTSGTYAQPLA